jgi:hypothetical protein
MSKGLIDQRRMTRLALAAACTGVLIGAPTIQAQRVLAAQVTPANVKVPAYDIVSIKPNKTGSGHVDIDIDDENLTAANVSLKTLIRRTSDG